MGLIHELRRDAADAGMFRGDRVAIDFATALGLFCAVAVHPVYCRATDAHLGESPELLGAFRTREEADAKLAWEDVDDATSGESAGIVEGPVELTPFQKRDLRVAHEGITSSFDDIPF
jgi:hypothetical protein